MLSSFDFPKLRRCVVSFFHEPGVPRSGPSVVLLSRSTEMIIALRTKEAKGTAAPGPEAWKSCLPRKGNSQRENMLPFWKILNHWPKNDAMSFSGCFLCLLSFAPTH